jgi:hypothetical protein
MGREARASDTKRAAISLVLDKITFKGDCQWMRRDGLIVVNRTPPLADGKQYYISHMLTIVDGRGFVGGFLMTGDEDAELLQANAHRAEESLYNKLKEVPVDAPPADPAAPVDA